MFVVCVWKKGIYLVNFDEKIDMDNLKKVGGNVEVFVIIDNVVVGVKGVLFIIDKLGVEGGEVVIIEGKVGNVFGEVCCNGVIEVFKKVSQIKFVVSQFVDWDCIKVLDVVINVL